MGTFIWPKLGTSTWPPVGTLSWPRTHAKLDRKTVRKYLAGDGTPGVRARSGPDPFEPFADYVTARLVEDPHLWVRTLFDELEDLGFGLSYQSLTRIIRERGLRPVCHACRTATDRPNAVIEHTPGDETQWDWLELPNPPTSWGWGKSADLLVGSLAHSGKWRAVLSASQDQPHLIAGLGASPHPGRRCEPGVAVRPDAGRRVIRPPGGQRLVRRAGQALRVSVAITAPPRRGKLQGRGGEGQPHRRPAVVAHPWPMS
ncbi:transcriptional regulator [Mycolicibacterium sp.]|uniref:transcriptional regulator n=1 Tax=Mycolicibacterium sp. TaxID=2320850 RepID=UPI0025DE4CAC|nr:transcriptional regulator [Mycolicibacterium sp.]